LTVWRPETLGMAGSMPTFISQVQLTSCVGLLGQGHLKGWQTFYFSKVLQVGVF
jgi:hypothetical protein